MVSATGIDWVNRQKHTKDRIKYKFQVYEKKDNIKIKPFTLKQLPTNKQTIKPYLTHI